MTFSRLQTAIMNIRQLADKADVSYPMRVSISFGDAGDRDRFKAEVMRESQPEQYRSLPRLHDEYEMFGVCVRIV